MLANLFSEFNSMFTDFIEQLVSWFTKVDERLNNWDSVSLSSVQLVRELLISAEM